MGVLAWEGARAQEKTQLQTQPYKGMKSWDNWRERNTVWSSPQDGILLSHRKERSPDSCYVGEPREHRAERQQPDAKGHTV